MNNDRFRFRAWSRSKMYNDDHIYHNGGFHHFLEDLNCVMMQWTGLHDRNGKPIYEGDILKQILTNAITMDDFHGYRFMWGEDQLCRANAEYGEVIGNIHENPELLKG